METPFSPLRSSPPREIHLENAPLLRVIGQIRFPLVESINDGKFIGPFQEDIKGGFPVLRKDVLPALRLTPSGPIQDSPKTVWRFNDIGENWRLSLAPDFVALETVRYDSRSDFISRFREVYRAVLERIDIPIVDRIGLRYIDRISVASREEILELTSPEVAGILSTPLADDAELSLQESVFDLRENGGKLRAKWGMVPPNSTVDPLAIEPSAEQTWIMDLDAFSTSKQPFTEEQMATVLEKFAEKAYSVFRWAVTDEFLKRYGGKI